MHSGRARLQLYYCQCQRFKTNQRHCPQPFAWFICPVGNHGKRRRQMRFTSPTMLWQLSARRLKNWQQKAALPQGMHAIPQPTGLCAKAWKNLVLKPISTKHIRGLLLQLLLSRKLQIHLCKNVRLFKRPRLCNYPANLPMRKPSALAISAKFTWMMWKKSLVFLRIL